MISIISFNEIYHNSLIQVFITKLIRIVLFEVEYSTLEDYSSLHAKFCVYE